MTVSRRGAAWVLSLMAVLLLVGVPAAWAEPPPGPEPAVCAEGWLTLIERPEDGVLYCASPMLSDVLMGVAVFGALVVLLLGVHVVGSWRR